MKSAILLLTIMLCMTGCGKEETATANAEVSVTAETKKELNNVTFELEEEWKKISRDEDNVSYNNTAFDNHVTISVFAPIVPDLSVDAKMEYLQYKALENIPDAKETVAEEIGNYQWQIYKGVQTEEKETYVTTCYATSTDTSVILVTFRFPENTQINEAKILRTIKDEMEEWKLEEPTDGKIWQYEEPMYLNTGWVKTSEGIYENGKEQIKMTVMTETSGMEAELHLQYGLPDKEEKIQIGSTSYLVMLYKTDSNQHMDTNRLYYIGDNGVTYLYEGQEDIKDYRIVIEKSLGTIKENTKDE